MNTKFLGVIVLAAVVLVGLSVFTVDEREKAIKFRLGEIVRTDYEPGLYFQTPFINNVRKFDARIQTLDAKPTRYLTKEKKNVIVDSFVKWRIGDLNTYYVTMGGDPLRANAALFPIVNDQLRSEFGKRTIREVVSGERAEVMNILAANTKAQAVKYGIDVIDVRIKRVDLPQNVSGSVYDRMRAERDRVAKELRARGRAEGERIRADADRQYTVILAEAYRDAQTLRGEGDAKAAEIYARAYSKNEEFYSLYRSLNAYKTSFGSKNDVLVIEPDADFFKYFNSPKGKK
jgi:membrane protease subunit HflC